MSQDSTEAWGPGTGWCSPAQRRARVRSLGLRWPLLRRGQRCVAGSETVVCSTWGPCQGHGWQPPLSVLLQPEAGKAGWLSAGVRGPGLSGPGSQGSTAPRKLCCDSRQLQEELAWASRVLAVTWHTQRSRPGTPQASGSRESDSGWRLQAQVGRAEPACGLVAGTRPEGRGCSTSSPEHVGAEGARG